MESVNELQRDFRKGTMKLLSMLEPFKEDTLIDRIRQHIIEKDHLIHFLLSPGIKKEYPRLEEELLKLSLHNFTLSFQLPIKQMTPHSISSQFEMILSSEIAEALDQTNTQVLYLIVEKDSVELKSLHREYRTHPQVVICNLDPEQELKDWLPYQSFFLKHIYANEEAFFQEKIGIIEKVLKRKQNIMRGQQILNKSQEINVANGKNKSLQRKSVQLKSRLSNNIKKSFSALELEVQNNFNPDTEVFKSLYQEINGYRGFNEQDDSRNTTYSIPPEYTDSIKNQLRQRYSDQIDLLVQKIEETNKNLYASIQEVSQALQINTIPEIRKDFPREIVHKTIEREEVIIKKYEKGVPKKGIYQLLMELRTPLYIIFPLFIIARFINTSDEGAINSAQSSLSGEPVVVISKLPETYNNNEQKFMAALNKQLNNGELVNQSTGEEIFRYRLDSRGQRKQAVYYMVANEVGENQIVLPVESDRNLAIEMLENGLLKISKRFNVFKELQKIPMIFGPFKNLFGPVVLILVIWYIKSRRDRMHDEKVLIRLREQNGLISELLRDIGKLTNSVESTFISQLRSYSRSLSDELGHLLEKAFGEKLKLDELRSLQQLKLIKERDQHFQREIKESSQTGKSVQEISREFNQSVRKFNN